MMKRFLLLFLMVLLYSRQSEAQFTVLGTDDPSVKWMRMDTSSVRIIFPDFAEKPARIFGSHMLRHKRQLGLSMRSPESKLPILMHPDPMFSNGMVVWTPKRLEINLIPPVDGSSQPWLEQLAIHEYRHVRQMDVLRSGLAGIGQYVIGEQAVGLMAAFVPRWMYEGDAVMMETALSSAGRGRSASFSMPLRAILEDSTLHYGYDKLTLGSERDFVPDHYVYGYHFMSYMRKEYGPDFWDKVMHYISWRPFLVQPKSFAIRKYAGRWQSSLHISAMNEWKRIWAEETASGQSNPAPLLEIQHFEAHNLVSVQQAFPLPDGGAVFLQTDRRRIPKWVLRTADGTEKLLCRPGIIMGKAIFSYPYLAWAEYNVHPRYEMAAYSVIRCIDVRTGKYKHIEDGNLNRTVAMCFQDSNRLWVLHFASEGRYLLHRINLNESDSSTRPEQRFEWAPQGEERICDLFHMGAGKLGMLCGNERGMYLESFDFQTQKRVPLFRFPEQWNNIQHTQGDEQEVLFSSDRSGVDNIFSYRFADGRIRQLTHARYGMFYPVTDASKRQLWVSDYTSKGYRSLVFERDSCKNDPIDFSQRPSFPMAEMLREQECRLDSLADSGLPKSNASQGIMRIRPYSGLERAVQIHSWAPFYYNPASLLDGSFSEAFAPGASLLSQNLLGTLYGNLAYAYKNNRNTFQASLAYRKYWPIFSLSTRINENPRYTLNVEMPTQTGDQAHFNVMEDRCPSMEVNALVTLPYSRYFRSWTYGMALQAGWSVDNSRYDQDFSASEDYRTLSYGDLAATAFVKRIMALRDLYPSMGIQVNARYRKHLLGASQYNTSLIAYLPGFFPNQSLRLGWAWEAQRSDNWAFSSLLAAPRYMGSDIYTSRRIIRTNADYALPLWYPDWSIPKILYVKKIHANLFAEQLWYSLFGDKGTYYRSYGVGADLWTTFHVLHLGYEMQLGYRAACDLSNGNKWVYQLMFSLPF